jgi:hypothetical protein
VGGGGRNIETAFFVPDFGEHRPSEEGQPCVGERVCPKKTAELSAAVDVAGRSHDRHAATPELERPPEIPEERRVARDEPAEKIEIFFAERDEGDAAVPRRGEDRIGRAFPKLERGGETRRRRGNISADEDDAGAIRRGPPGGEPEPAPQRGAALLEKIEPRTRERTPPARTVTVRRGDDDPRAAPVRGVDPSPGEGSEEPFPGRGREALGARFAPGLPGEEDQNARGHPGILRRGTPRGFPL